MFPLSRALAASLAAGLLSLSVAAGAAQAAPSIVTYALPAGAGGGGSGLAVDGAGDVWFSLADGFTPTPRIGRLTVAQAAPGTSNGVALWPTPAVSATWAQLRLLDADPQSGRIWFTRSDSTYGYVRPGTPAGGTPQFATARTPGGTNNSVVDLYGLAFDLFSKVTFLAETSAGGPQGNGDRIGSRIASTDAGLGLSELPSLASWETGTFTSARFDAKPRGLTPDGKGGVWFAQQDAGGPGYRIGHATPGGYTAEYPIDPPSGVATGRGPTETALAGDGALWFTNEHTRSVGRLDVAAKTFTHYALASMGAGLGAGRPMALRSAADGTLWLAVYGGPSAPAANAIVQITPGSGAAAPTATTYATGASGPYAVEPAAGGDVWFTLNPSSGDSQLGRLTGAVAADPGPGPGPGDGAPDPGAGGGAAQGGGTPVTPTTTTLAPSAVGVAQVGRTRSDGDRVSVRQLCVGPPEDRCSLVYLLDSREYVKGFPGTQSALRLAAAPKQVAAKKPKKPKTVELGRTEATLTGGQSADVRVRLSKKARGLLAKRGTLKATLRVMQRGADGSLTPVSSKPVTFKAKQGTAKKR